MDQNVVRTDLLPETISLWVIALLAAAAVGVWVACHWAARRYGANKMNVWCRALLGVPPGLIACWLVLQTLGRLMFLATPWSLFFAATLGALAVEAVCAFYTHECARVPAKTARILVACRVAAVAITLLVLTQPVVVGERERTVKERVLVLVDDSQSMHFLDRQMTPEEEKDVAAALGLAKLPEEGMTRAEMVRQLMAKGGEDSFLSRAARKYEVDVFRFGNGLVRDESLGQGEERAVDSREKMFRSVTDLTKALELAVKEVPAEEISSILVFSDGRHNGDAGVESVARKLGSYGIQVSTVLVGGTVKPFDLSIAAADSPESVFLGDKVRFTVRVAATRANGRKAKLRLSDANGQLDEKEFTVEGDDWSKEFKFTDVPKEQGVYSYVLKVSNLEGELFEDNNERRLDVAVSDDRTNVLLVDGRPRWEYRYLRNLFYGRDKSVHLQDWLVHPDSIAGVQPKLLEYASASRPFGQSEAGGWPIQDNDWRQFDVIIVGDVGEDVLTDDVVEQLRYNVEDRGALLVLISGSEYMPYSIRNQKLRDLMPVEYDPSSESHRVAPEDAFVFQLAAAGRGHVVMNQSSSSSENEDIWAEIPDFHWRLPLKGVKAGADVLAYAKPKKENGSADMNAMAESIAATIEENPEAALKRLEDMRNEQARNALVVAGARGKGRVLMLMTDSMWRLRSKSGDQLHHRFWGQIMRWGAGEKLRNGNLYVRIGTDQLRYGAGETVKVFARFLDEKHNGIEGLEPRFLVRTPDSGNRVQTFSARKRPDSNGLYECEIHGCVSPGVYTVNLECQKALELLGRRYPRELATKFSVVTTKQPAEEVDITATRNHVERVAAATGGKVLSPTEYVALKTDFGGGSRRLSDRVEFHLWSLPPLFLAIIALLTAEWILRKRSSLA
ncbi:MAG: VWA domain-containing protein [Kiritimatiellae bacterium]|nr:VWA domain-containing protein [Kiritimatiellia bacterium]